MSFIFESNFTDVYYFIIESVNVKNYTNHLLRLGQVKKKKHSANKQLYALHTSPRSTSCITAINWCFFKKEYTITIAETIKNRKVVQTSSLLSAAHHYYQSLFLDA